MRKTLPYLLLFVLFFTGCAQNTPNTPIVCRDYILNTEVSITVYQQQDQAAAQEALELCREYENIFSRTNPDSELYRLNSREVSIVSPELAEVITLGLEYAALSDGAFDITMGTVTSLWDFTASEPSVPAASDIQEGVHHAGWKKVSVKGNTITFADNQTTIDLGGIAKGYIADRLADYLRDEGVPSAIINLGGNLYCLGGKIDGSDFQVGIQYPYEARNETIGGLSIREGSVVTSGVYERCFEKDGILYHHILNPDTGYPAESGLLAVSIVSETSVAGDALSTVCFVLGLEDGMALLESLEDTEGVFITEDFQIHLTSGLVGRFSTI